MNSEKYCVTIGYGESGVGYLLDENNTDGNGFPLPLVASYNEARKAARVLDERSGYECRVIAVEALDGVVAR